MLAHACTFDPPPEVTISDSVSLYATEARMTRDGLVANVQVFNGHLIYEERVRTSNQLARRRTAKAVNERAPSITILAVEDALIHLNATLPALLRQDRPEGDREPALSDEQKAALRENAHELATAPDLLDRINRAFGALGMVGEERNRKLLYLAATARLLPKPVSVFVTGPSSAGKSYLLQQVLHLLPPSAYVNYTSVSARYLAYSDDDLRHRIVVLYEADGLSEGIGAYIMRSLISENRLELGTVEKTEAGQLGTRRVAKEGPTALFSSTTEARKIDDELLTRLLRVVVADSPEHSRAILQGIAQAHMDTTQPMFDVTPFHALQEWLSMVGERRVTIPYAASLARKVPVGTVRIRRDFPQLLSLIKACAILYQAQRTKAPDGCIVAHLDDYRIVRELLAESFTAAQQDGLTPDQREAVQAVAALHANRSADSGVSLKAVADHLQRDKSATSRRLVNPLRAGYVVNLNAGLKGRKAAYIPGDPLPDVSTALPDPNELDEEGTA